MKGHKPYWYKDYCAKCGKELNRLERHSYRSLGEGYWGIKNPNLCFTCAEEWVNYFRRHRDEKDWIDLFQEWLGYQWKQIIEPIAWSVS